MGVCRFEESTTVLEYTAKRRAFTKENDFDVPDVG